MIANKRSQFIWTDAEPDPNFPDQTLPYQSFTFVSPGRPQALVNFGQIYPRFYEEVDEETVPASTSSGAVAELDHFDFANNQSLQDTFPLDTSRNFLRDKRPRVGLLFPRGNTYRSDER